MALGFPVDSSYYSMHDAGSQTTQDMPNEGGGWYYSRKEIEENSPSRKDGVDLKKENYLRKSYCTFLQDLGMRLKVPQVTIATAILFCHRFFLRQSHAKNDRRTIATVCMFLAGKVEESPRPLKDVILVSYEIIHKKDPNAIQRIKQKEVYEQQKELILQGERSVLATLAFDFNVHHPYKPLVEAIKKFKVAQNALAQVAWNFVNDGLRTSLCLQLRPHHIAAGAIFLAAKFLKVKLPSDGDKVWWQEFDVTPRQLEEVSNQMLELYEQNRVFPPQASEAENLRASAKPPSSIEDYPLTQSTGTPSKSGSLKPSTSLTTPSHLVLDDDDETSQNRENYEVANEYEQQPHYSDNTVEVDRTVEEYNEGKNAIGRSGVVRQSPPHDTIKRIDKNKVKAALEKQRKSRGDVRRKNDLMGDDDDDLIEWELEDGIELADAEKKKQQEERRQSLLRSGWSDEHGVEDNGREIENVEEGEFGNETESWGHEHRSEKLSNRKRKSPESRRWVEEEEEEEEVWNGNKQNHNRQEERKRKNKYSYNSERDEKKRRHMENNNHS